MKTRSIAASIFVSCSIFALLGVSFADPDPHAEDGRSEPVNPQAEENDLIKITKERIPMKKELLTLCVGPETVVGPHAAAEVDLFVNEAVVDYRKKNPESFSYPVGSKFVKKTTPISPPSGPAWAGVAQRRLPQRLFQQPPAEGNLLLATLPGTPGV